MDSVEVVLAMLVAVVASAYLVRAVSFPVPLPLMQIALGALIAALSDHAVTLDPAVFFLLFLPPLLFLDGWRMPNDRLLRDKAAILELALGLVVFTVLGAGFLIHWLIPTMPLAVAFALAAIVSPTDPVAVSSITSRVPMPKRLMHILQGEALLNDASGLVCFRFAVAAALTGGFSLLSASMTFLWMAVAGLGLGVGVTLAVTSAQRALSQWIGEDKRLADPDQPVDPVRRVPAGGARACLRHSRRGGGRHHDEPGRTQRPRAGGHPGRAGSSLGHGVIRPERHHVRAAR